MDILQALQNQYVDSVDIEAEFSLGPQAGGGDLVPGITEGLQVLSQSITLGKAANKVLVKVSLWGEHLGSSMVGALFRGTTCLDARGLAFAGYDVDAVQTMASIDEPGSVGPHVYSVRVGIYNFTEDAGFGAPVRLNGMSQFDSGGRLFGGVAKCTLTLLEIG